jgi:uncharacterized protein YndB with AHSA1/START domain
LSHESFSVSEVIPAPADQIYSAWLDTAAHSAFTGDEATVEPFVGGRHTAFRGYAEGTTLELSPGRRIVQTWRAKDFPEGSLDSRLEVTFEETLGGTMVTILHSEIPSGQGERYREGWVKFYLQALKLYFAGPQRGDAEELSAGEGIPDLGSVEPVTVPAKASHKNGAPRPHRAAAARKPAKVAAKAAPRKSAAKARKPAKPPAAAAKRAAAKPKPAKAKGAKAKRKGAARPAQKAGKKTAKKRGRR